MAAHKYFIRGSDVEGFSPENHSGTVNKRLVAPDTVGAEHLEVVLGIVGGEGGEVMSVDLESSTRLSTLAVSPARTLHALARSATGQVVTVGFPGVIPLPIPEKRHSLR